MYCEYLHHIFAVCTTRLSKLMMKEAIIHSITNSLAKETHIAMPVDSRSKAMTPPLQVSVLHPAQEEHTSVYNIIHKKERWKSDL